MINQEPGIYVGKCCVEECDSEDRDYLLRHNPGNTFFKFLEDPAPAQDLLLHQIETRFENLKSQIKTCIIENTKLPNSHVPVTKDPCQEDRSLVLLGLAEGGDDFANADEICRHLDSSVVIHSVYRLGSPRPGITRPRPLKVVLNSCAAAMSVIRQSPKLRFSWWRLIFVRKCWNDVEMLRLKELHENVVALNEAERDAGFTVKFGIRNGHIVRYVNCVAGLDGKLGRGILDKEYRNCKTIFAE